MSSWNISSQTLGDLTDKYQPKKITGRVSLICLTFFVCACLLDSLEEIVGTNVCNKKTFFKSPVLKYEVRSPRAYVVAKVFIQSQPPFGKTCKSFLH